MDEIIIGTMRWGKWGENFTPNQASVFLNKLFENSFKTFDLADIYGDYTTESLFGKALNHSGIKRNEIKIISKCGIQYPTNSNQIKVKSYNTSKKYIFQQVERSLNEINTDYLDLLLIHRPDPLMNLSELSETFKLLIKNGYVKNCGVSNFSFNEICLLSKVYKVYTNQIELSLSNYNNLFTNIFQQAELLGYRPQIWSPLGNIFIEKSEKNNKILDLLSKLSIKYKCQNIDIILAWIRKLPSKPIPILGSTNIDRFLNLNINLEIDVEDWFIILETITEKKVA